MQYGTVSYIRGTSAECTLMLQEDR